MKSKLSVILLCAAVMCSCVDAGKITITEFTGVEVRGLSRLEIGLTVDNRSSYKVVLRSARFTVSEEGRELAELTLPGEVTVARRSEQQLAIPVRLRLSDPLAALRLPQLLAGDPDRFAVSGTARLKAGWGSKKITLDRVPLSQIIRMFEE